MSCRLTILASGSSGNCAFLETETTRLLVDAGLSGRQIEERLGSIGKSPADLHGILVTHEHSDHIQGIRVLAGRYQIPVYANRGTKAAILDTITTSSPQRAQSIPWKIFEAGQAFPAGDFDVEPFSIPHDAADPVGFLLHHGGRCIAFLTDLGHVTQLVLEKAKQADTLVLETNHDMKLLQNDPYRPWSVKQRISGRHGHLSNEAAAKALSDIMTDRIRHVYLSHLSRDCNSPALAENTIRKTLQKIGATSVHVTVTCPRTPCSTQFLDPLCPLPSGTLPLFTQLHRV